MKKKGSGLMPSETFQIDAATTIATVHLKVMDLAKEKTFYQRIGLELVAEMPQLVALGVKGNARPLVVLHELSHPQFHPKKTGLYHVALKVPSQAALSNCLYHLLLAKVPLIGAADHGYSEALYLQDFEGNGIEIYYDKQRALWPKAADGSIHGKTAELALDDLLELRAANEVTVLPVQTTIGHVHLAVNDLAAMGNFFKQLGFQLVDDQIPDALFLAAGSYHHHVAINHWQKNLRQAEALDTGLQAVVFQLPAAGWQALQKEFVRQNIQYTTSGDELSVCDPEHNQFIFTKEVQAND
jgi:catechol 2,3-dioxygenase